MNRLLATTLLAAMVSVATAADAPPDAAPADAWPMARGCPAGTGRSAATLRLPLAEDWHREFEKTAFGAVPIVAGDTIYIGDLDGTFHALAVDTGTTRWTFKAEAAGFPSAAAVAADATLPVVVGDDTGVVRGLDRRDGRLVWEYETEGEISGGPTIVTTPAGPRAFVGSQDASLSCLSLADGKQLWKHSIADQIRCSPTVAHTKDGDCIFIAGCDGKLHVIDAEKGAERATVPIDGPTGTTPATLADRVFFGTEGGVFFAIDFLKAEVAWRQQAAAGAQAYRSSAAVAGDLAVVGSRGRAVEAFSLADGTRKWRRPIRARVDASPVVVMATGGMGAGAAARPVVIVVDAGGGIAALDLATGEPAWEFAAGGGFGAGAAVAGDRVVIASDDGTIWCFRSGGG